MKKFGKALRWLLVIGAGLFLIAQLIRPARTNPISDHALALESRVQVDPKVAGILERSCADCHSNNTRWPWYSNVSPVSWFVVGHVNDGRQVLNFSAWGSYDKRRQTARLEQMCDLARAGVMPLGSYTPLHHGSKLSDDDVKVLCDWTRAQR